MKTVFYIAISRDGRKSNKQLISNFLLHRIKANTREASRDDIVDCLRNACDMWKLLIKNGFVNDDIRQAARSQHDVWYQIAEDPYHYLDEDTRSFMTNIVYDELEPLLHSLAKKAWSRHVQNL